MARLEQPNISVARAIGCLLSIGTGVSIYEVFPPNKRAVLKKYIRYLKAITKELTDAVSVPFPPERNCPIDFLAGQTAQDGDIDHGASWHPLSSLQCQRRFRENETRRLDYEEKTRFCTRRSLGERENFNS